MICLFEAGLTITVNYPPSDDANVFGFVINGKTNSFEDYDGIYVERNSTSVTIKIVVGVTTTITEAGVTQQR